MHSWREQCLQVSLWGREVLAVRVGGFQEGEAPPAMPAAPATTKVTTAPPSTAIPNTPISNCDVPATNGNTPVVAVSSLLLHDCFNLLTRTEDEDLHVLTGLVFPRTRVLERIVPLRLSRQGVAGAGAADDSLAAELIRLHEFGMVPLAYFHSHPGHGPSATFPSSTDRRTQAGMELAGGQIIGGIFSRDGFVRFYANRAEPHVKVFGKRVRRIGRNVYHLEDEQDIQG